MKERKPLFITIMTIQITIICLAVSYGWFSDKSNPSIREDNIKVATAEGLVIKLAPDSAARTNVNLNELLTDFSEFELKQMSSADAIDFYTIDFGGGLANNDPQYVLIRPDDNGRIDMLQHGCIDYDFYLQTEAYSKHVYLHKDTSIVGDAADAIRIAITVDDINYNYRMIFGTTAENGIGSTPYVTKAVIEEGTFSYVNINNNNYVGNQIVHTFNEKNGGRGVSDDASIDLTKVMFTMPANTTLKVNVKIWLEGGDPDCDNYLSETMANVIVKFGSANELRDAPNVYALIATRTIANLTTDMEYAYTNNIDTLWTPVTNVDIQFNRGTTVYVRYKEVPGVSLASYVTTVDF